MKRQNAAFNAPASVPTETATGKRRPIRNVASRLLLLVATLALFTAHCGAGDEEVIIRKNPRVYRVSFDFQLYLGLLRYRDMLGKVNVYLPWPPDNVYQEVVAPDMSDKGARYVFRENGAPYFLEEIYHWRKDPFKALPLVSKFECEVTAYDVQTDFGRIVDVYPYLQSSSLFKMYTRNQETFVVTNHPTIRKIADTIKGRGGSSLEFARKAFDHVLRTYRHLPGAKELNPLEKILELKAGSGADLASVFVSLLRRMGVPARHVFAKDPNGNPYFFAEFYLEHYGWVPVDIVRALGSPSRQGFGVLESPRGLIVHSTDVELSLVGLHLDEVKKIDCMLEYQCLMQLRTNAARHWEKLDQGKHWDYFYSFSCEKLEDKTREKQENM